MTEAALTSTSDTRNLASLPDEILSIILTLCPPSTVLSLSLVCQRFYTLTSSPLLWRHYCETRFTHWDRRHDIHARLNDHSFTEWKAIFAARHSSNKLTSSAFQSMISSENNRFDHIHDILSVGYDAKDFLLHAYKNSVGQERHLAQRYWSHAVLGCLHRAHAVERWMLLKYRGEHLNSTEQSFAALDMFVLGEREEGDINDIFARLDSYATSIRSANPGIDSAIPREKAATIAQHLLDKRWVGISDSRDYHSLDHMFLGVSLFSTNRNSVPLISAIIYCYVSRQFGLYAEPISYPFHVHALIKPPPGIDLDGDPLPEDFDTTSLSSSTHLFMDPFSSAESVPLAHLLRQLSFVAPLATDRQKASFLSPSTARDLTIRAAHNILSSPSHYPHPPLFPIPAHSASYAALVSLCILPTPTHPAQLRQHVAVLAQHFLEHFDIDVDLFEEHILPLTTMLPDAGAYRSLIDSLRANDKETRPPKYRTPPTNTKTARPGSTPLARQLRVAIGETLSDDDDLPTEAPTQPQDTSWISNSTVKFKIGQVFRHRRRGCLAVIYGWDPFCKMQEEWIVINAVDRLPNGRGQPFYNVLVDDESTRYVAEENVQLLEAHEVDEEIVDRFPIQIGKWFQRWDQARGVFVSNITGEYPDD